MSGGDGESTPGDVVNGSTSVQGKWDPRVNLKPQRAGEPGHNQTGRNQYSYKRDFERTVDALLRGKPVNGELDKAPRWLRDAVLPGMTRGEALAAATVAGAFSGDLKHLATVLKRIWPEVTKHEVIQVDAPPAFSPLENLNDEDRATMLRLAQKAIRNGDG